MPILGYPAHPEHDQVSPAAVVFGVSDRDPALAPVPMHLLADFPREFLDRVEAGDWHLYALDFGRSDVYAIAMWVDNPAGEDFPLFVVNTTFLTGDQTVREALLLLVDDALDPETDRVPYMRLPVVDTAARAMAQRAEWHLDLSDELLGDLAERAVHEDQDDELAMWQAYACPDCGHLAGCGCDCCPYPMPATTGLAQMAGV